ncbi:helix-hairpin-helix domain-containing protein [Postechiella marina]|uniref:Helix-hairpin-helix domain-containing protein n=1 Tax=Postechiella marina TaxID=943941 RepID=A0ABP8CHK3_9FLAO
MKSHFTFSKEQRNGIFLLVLIIIILQGVYFFIDFSSESIIVNKAELEKYTKEIDSLRLVKLKNNEPKIYPFNPNYITDFKGESLGMSNKEIDRLHAFRKQDKWINSSKQFQEVTQISDSLLKKISPFFKFPEWVTHPKPVKPVSNYRNKPKTFSQKQDLNKATAKQLQKVYGIGETFSKRIINYREKHKGGFIADVQLQDIYGLTPETIEYILKDFTVKTPRKINKVKLNTASVDELVTVKYIDYDVAYYIVEYRQLREGFKSLDELIKVKDFPLNKFDIIKLYLSLE